MRARFVCKHPEKYAGDPQRIYARSKFELAYMAALDSSNLVKKWISEPKNLNIRYVSPIDKKVHQYWPDFLVQYVDGSVELLEFKPTKEALAQEAKTTYDKLSLIKNAAKWAAADRFAKTIGGRFRVITENHFYRRKTSIQPKRSKTARPPKRPRGTS